MNDYVEQDLEAKTVGQARRDGQKERRLEEEEDQYVHQSRGSKRARSVEEPASGVQGRKSLNLWQEGDPEPAQPIAPLIAKDKAYDEFEESHPAAQTRREWQERRKQLALEGEAHGRGSHALGFFGRALTKVGAMGAQDEPTAGKVLGGIGRAAERVVDHMKFAPGDRAPEVVKAGLQDGGALLEIAGRGITHAAGMRPLDTADEQRRRHIAQRDAFLAMRADMRQKLGSGQRANGTATGTLRELVKLRMTAQAIGTGVSEMGMRPNANYTMSQSATINNMRAVRSSKDRAVQKPGRPRENMTVNPGEVIFSRVSPDPNNYFESAPEGLVPGWDAGGPKCQTPEERAEGSRAKALAAPGRALMSAGKVLDGTEHGQRAIQQGHYLKGGVQAILAGARSIGKGAAKIAAEPLGLGVATSALIDVGAVAAGGLLQAAGGGLNAVGGVGDKARTQREIESYNKHHYGEKHFLPTNSNQAKNAEEDKVGESGEEENKGAGQQVGDAADAQAPALPRQDAPVKDAYFDTARARSVAERGLRAETNLKEGDYDIGNEEAGLPAIDHGNAFKNWWHNRMKRPLKKVGQGLLKPLALLTKGVGYATGVLPLMKHFQNKKRKKAIEAAINKSANRRDGSILGPEQDSMPVDGQEVKEADPNTDAAVEEEKGGRCLPPRSRQPPPTRSLRTRTTPCSTCATNLPIPTGIARNCAQS